MTVQVLAFPYPCDLEWRPRSFKMEHTVECSHVKHHPKFEMKRFTSVPMHTNSRGIFYKMMQTDFSSLNINPANWIWHKLQQTNRLWQKTDIHPNQLKNLWENGHRSFWFPIFLRPWLNQTGIKIENLVVSITIPSLKETSCKCLITSQHQSCFFCFFLTK